MSQLAHHVSAHPAESRLRKFLKSLRAPMHFLFGDDIFISYSRLDGGAYAAGIASALTDKGLECRLDSWGCEPGKTVSPAILRAAGRAAVFVLIGTRGAALSKNVVLEVKRFRRTNRPIVPLLFEGVRLTPDPVVNKSVDSDRDVSGHPAPVVALWADLIEGVPHSIESPSAVITGHAEDTANRIARSFTFIRKYERLRAASIAVTAMLIALLAASGAAASLAWWQGRRAADASNQVATLSQQAVELENRVTVAQKDLQVLQTSLETARKVLKTEVNRRQVGESSEAGNLGAAEQAKAELRFERSVTAAVSLARARERVASATRLATALTTTNNHAQALRVELEARSLLGSPNPPDSLMSAVSSLEQSYTDELAKARELLEGAEQMIGQARRNHAVRDSQLKMQNLRLLPDTFRLSLRNLESGKTSNVVPWDFEHQFELWSERPGRGVWKSQLRSLSAMHLLDDVQAAELLKAEKTLGTLRVSARVRHKGTLATNVLLVDGVPRGRAVFQQAATRALREALPDGDEYDYLRAALGDQQRWKRVVDLGYLHVPSVYPELGNNELRIAVLRSVCASIVWWAAEMATAAEKLAWAVKQVSQGNVANRDALMQLEQLVANPSNRVLETTSSSSMAVGCWRSITSIIRPAKRPLC